MFIAIYKDANDVSWGGLYDRYENYFADTFSPECEELFFWDFTSRGKSYADRKEFVREKAIDWSYVCGEASWLSMGELWYVEDAFRRLGKRYGLLREFAENCIC